MDRVCWSCLGSCAAWYLTAFVAGSNAVKKRVEGNLIRRRPRRLLRGRRLGGGWLAEAEHFLESCRGV